MVAHWPRARERPVIPGSPWCPRFQRGPVRVADPGMLAKP